MTGSRPETGKVVVDLTLGAIIVFTIVEASDLPQQARQMPTVVGIATLVFLALGVLNEVFPKYTAFLRPRTPRSDETSTLQAEQPADWSTALRVITYLLLFWVLVFFFGLYLVPPVLVTLYLVFEARVRPLIATVLALAATALTMLGLSVLGVQPWIGAGPEVIDGYVGGAVMPLF